MILSRRFIAGVLATALILPAIAYPATPSDAPLSVSSTGIPGVEPPQLSPQFWIGRLRAPNRVVLDSGEITSRNALLTRLDASMHDLDVLPATLDHAQVARWVGNVSHRPGGPLFDASGQAVDSAVLDTIVANADLVNIPAQESSRFGLAVRRTDMRTFPTRLRVFSSTGDIDLDRFQESALFPGTPVAIVHESQDHQWWFVLSPTYAAWVPKQAIAEGPRSQVLDYAHRRPSLTITGATVRTTTTPEEPRVSDLQLDMGVRLPQATLPAGQTVNGQNAAASWVVLLPVRDDSGRLSLRPALLPRSADTTADALPLTRANTINQAFKFLGERYGWGDDYGTRDCSGFVSAVFASMGVVLPRNTGDQARNPVYTRLHLDEATPRNARTAAVDALEVGDLVYIPGHVMLVIGRIGGVPYVIHDIHDGKFIDANGVLQSLHLNGVVVTPLAPLQLDADRTFVDGITDIVRMLDGRPAPAAPVVLRQ
ncbi:SH3 domain-containing protein [Cognatiluteimonas profundi]|uniref:C40 family peptidase n=1 Tax=Cognatiluteimonas profundi TaxID=2594501 RepID=UPI001E3A393A|nr:SH3 domain-containing protein [Lysobacter profundi]